MKKSLRGGLPLNLQMFAESQNNTQTDSNASNEQLEHEEEESETEEKHFTQEEVDSIVADRLKRERENSNKKRQEEIDAAVKKALEREKSLAKMTDAEKREQELLEREQAIAEREAEADYKELLSDTKNNLVDRELPSDLAELIVVKGDVDATLERIKLIETIIKQRDAERDKARLRQNDPKMGAGNISDNLSEGAKKALERSKVKEKPVVSNWG